MAFLGSPGFDFPNPACHGGASVAVFHRLPFDRRPGVARPAVARIIAGPERGLSISGPAEHAGRGGRGSDWWLRMR